ncbi:MAG: effector-associated domain EAD1-containing protein [Thioalkalivibrio sp.]|nr:effector-associated domain EAD1-containing protein [Thioalkalivibrio sp.]
MIVHQALYGPRGEAHSLLGTSFSDPDPAEELTNRTDRPGAAQPSMRWLPFMSGFPVSEHYVLMRTAADTTATRGGMVRTHALFLPLSGIGEVERLELVISHLDPLVELEATGGPLRLPDAVTSPADRSTIPEYGRIAALARALAQRAPDDGPVVWIGEDGFEAAVSAIWANLWPGARSALRFRLSFDPSDTQGHGLAIVSTPRGLRDRWDPECSVGPEAKEEAAEDPATAMLIGLPSGDGLRSLVRELGKGPPTINAIGRLAEAEAVLRDLSRAALPETMRALRILTVDAPGPKQAAAPKRRVVEHLAELLPAADRTAALALRNLPATALGEALNDLERAIAKWAEATARGGRAKAEAHTVISEALGGKGEVWWRAAVVRGLTAVLRNLDHGIARTLWSWWESDPDLVGPLFERLAADETTETLILVTAPRRIDTRLGAAFRTQATKRGWRRLHAAVITAILQPAEAIRAHLEFDAGGADDAIIVLAERIPPLELARGAAQTSDLRLVRIAGERLAADPKLAGGVVALGGDWISVLAAASEAGWEPWSGITEPETVLWAILDHAIDAPSAGVLSLLGRAGRGSPTDLWRYSRRGEVWTALPRAIAEPFLHATAEGWIRRYWDGASANSVPEAALERAIVATPTLLDGRFTSGQPPVRVLALFERFPAIAESAFEHWIATSVQRAQHWSEAEARQAGRLIRKRGWRSGARRIYQESANQSDLQPALDECASLLGALDQFRLLLLGPRKPRENKRALHGAWAEAFIEVAVDNFPDGPDQDYVWRRAGGDPSRLYGRSGRERWLCALDLIERGSAGKDIDARRLLDVMRRERPNNPQLTEIESAYFHLTDRQR